MVLNKVHEGFVSIVQSSPACDFRFKFLTKVDSQLFPLSSGAKEHFKLRINLN